MNRKAALRCVLPMVKPRVLSVPEAVTCSSKYTENCILEFARWVILGGRSTRVTTGDTVSTVVLTTAVGASEAASMPLALWMPHMSLPAVLSV